MGVLRGPVELIAQRRESGQFGEGETDRGKTIGARCMNSSRRAFEPMNVMCPPPRNKRVRLVRTRVFDS